MPGKHSSTVCWNFLDELVAAAANPSEDLEEGQPDGEARVAEKQAKISSDRDEQCRQVVDQRLHPLLDQERVVEVDEQEAAARDLLVPDGRARRVKVVADFVVGEVAGQGAAELVRLTKELASHVADQPDDVGGFGRGPALGQIVAAEHQKSGNSTAEPTFEERVENSLGAIGETSIASRYEVFVSRTRTQRRAPVLNLNVADDVVGDDVVEIVADVEVGRCNEVGEPVGHQQPEMIFLLQGEDVVVFVVLDEKVLGLEEPVSSPVTNHENLSVDDRVDFSDRVLGRVLQLGDGVRQEDVFHLERVCLELGFPEEHPHRLERVGRFDDDARQLLDLGVGERGSNHGRRELGGKLGPDVDHDGEEAEQAGEPKYELGNLVAERAFESSNFHFWVETYVET